MALFWYWCMLMVALQHKWRFFYVHLLDTNEFGPFSWRVFSIRVFFHGHWRLTREGTIYSTLPLPSAHEHSDIYFATFHVRWLSHISNRTACIFRAATWLDLPPYRITIWLINDVMLFVYLLSWVKVFVTAIGNRWTQTRIDYHPRITSKPTNEVC